MIVTVFGLGKLRPAPGSWGSLPPCVFVALALAFGLDFWIVNLVLALTVIVSSIACVQLGTWAEKRYHGKDPGVVVIDETAGMALALMFLPQSLLTPDGSPAVWATGYLIVMAAYVLFRILDIIKIQPANLMQQFPAGWGILLDDIVAGLYTNIVLQVIVRWGLPALIGAE